MNLGLHKELIKTPVIISIILVLICLFLNSFATADDWIEFKDQSEKQYYFLLNTDLQNFSCLFSSFNYINFIKTSYAEADSQYYYPLKFVWTKNNLYYILQPYPEVKENKERKDLLQEVQLTKKLFEGFYLDWNNFLLKSPFNNIPDSVKVEFIGDTVQVDYVIEDTNNEDLIVQKLFSRSGRLIKYSVNKGVELINIYPTYTSVKDKWLCTGWETQSYQNGKIIDGIACQLELKKVESEWLPTRADFIVQTVDKPEEKFVSIIFI